MFRSTRYLVASLAAAALAGCGVPAASALTAAAPSVTIPAVDVPNRSLTPGAVLYVGAGQVCKPGYASSVRNVPAAEKAQAYTRYHIRHVPYAHEVDHLVSLELGGSNAITNLWPEPYAGTWGARTKDTLENKLHSLVCNGSLTLSAAQHAIRVNWVAAYKRYTWGSHVPAPTQVQPRSDAGGFYASSYGSASTIYCADDLAWKNLSPNYLGHFTTWASAIAARPGYHLHQPC